MYVIWFPIQENKASVKLTYLLRILYANYHKACTHRNEKGIKTKAAEHTGNYRYLLNGEEFTIHRIQAWSKRNTESFFTHHYPRTICGINDKKRKFLCIITFCKSAPVELPMNITKLETATTRKDESTSRAICFSRGRYDQPFFVPLV